MKGLGATLITRRGDIPANDLIPWVEDGVLVNAGGVSATAESEESAPVGSPEKTQRARGAAQQREASQGNSQAYELPSLIYVH